MERTPGLVRVERNANQRLFIAERTDLWAIVTRSVFRFETIKAVEFVTTSRATSGSIRVVSVSCILNVWAVETFVEDFGHLRFRNDGFWVTRGSSVRRAYDLDLIRDNKSSHGGVVLRANVVANADDAFLRTFEFWHCPDVCGVICTTFYETKSVLRRVFRLSTFRCLDNALVLGPLAERFHLPPFRVPGQLLTCQLFNWSNLSVVVLLQSFR